MFFTNATFDEILLYSKALTEEEVLGLYAISVENKETNSQFDVSSCNLLSGEVYDIIFIGSLHTISKKIIAK